MPPKFISSSSLVGNTKRPDTSEWGQGVIEASPYSGIPEDEFKDAYNEAFPGLNAPTGKSKFDLAAPSNAVQDQLTNIVKERGTPMFQDEVIKTSQQIEKGGLSETLAAGDPETSGYREPTKDSLNRASDRVFDAMVPRLKSNPTFGDLDWEAGAPSTSIRRGGAAPQSGQLGRFVSASAPRRAPVAEDDYGWGIKNAFMRGMYRAGQLIDLAQDDYEEFAALEKEIAKHGVSERDAKRLQELQDTKGFWKALGYYITNPSLALQVVFESLPMSAAPLVGGAVGSIGGPAGAATGAGLGSFVTEYLASMSDAASEMGIDMTDPKAVKKIFEDEKFLEKARAHAAKRGVGVGAFDALSMGLAGRIYRPIAGAVETAEGAVKAANRGRAILGGTSEILAQGTYGALGEGAGQVLSEGRVTDAPAMAGEFIGELVPGVGEIAINKLRGKPAVSVPGEEGTPPSPEPTSPTDTTAPPAAGTETATPVEPPPVPPGEQPSTPLDIEDEAADMVVPETETPPPEQERVPEEQMASDETVAPKVREGAPSEDEVVGEQPVEDMLDQTAAEGETEAPAPAVESPLIDEKALAPKIDETIKSQKVQTPVRNAWRGVMKALKKRFPDSETKVPGVAFGGKGAAAFFKAIDEEAYVMDVIPDLKNLLNELTSQKKPADIINTLRRVEEKIIASIPSLGVTAPPGSISAQVQAVYNDFMGYYETAVRESKSKTRKGQKRVKGSKIKMANKLGELAVAVRDLVNAASETGALEESGLSFENYGRTLEIAFDVQDKAQAPLEKQTKSGGKTKTIAAVDKTLLQNAENLLEIAREVTPLLAEVEEAAAKAKAEKGKAKAAPKKETAKPEVKAEPKKETPHPNQSTADWVRQYVGGSIGVTAHTYEAIKKNLKLLEDKKHPEASLLRKRFEKTKYDVLKAKKDKLEAGTEVKLRDDLGKYRVVGIAQKGGTVEDINAGEPFISFNKTLGEAQKEAALLKRELHGDVIVDVSKQETPSFLAPGELQQIIKKHAKPKAEPKPVENAPGENEQANIQKLLSLVNQVKIWPAEKAAKSKISLAYHFRNVGDVVAKGWLSDENVNDLLSIFGAKKGKDLRETRGNLMVATAEVVKADRAAKAEPKAEPKPVKTAEEYIASSLSELVTQAKLVEKKGGIESYDGGEAAYSLGGMITSGNLSQADFTNLNMGQLRTIAKALGAKPAASKVKIIERIFAAADREVTQVEQTLAEMEEREAGKRFDPKAKPFVGHQSRIMRESVGAETKGEAFEKVGMSPEGAKKLRGVVSALGKEDGAKVYDAALSFMRHQNLARLVAEIADITGQTPSPAVTDAITEFALALDAQQQTEESQDLMDRGIDERLAEEGGISEDDIEIAKLTGNFDSLQETIEGWRDNAVDEYGLSYEDKLSGPFTKLKDKFKLDADRRAMKRALDKIRDKLNNIGSTTTRELNQLLLSALPPNHRFTNLLRLLQKTGIDIAVDFSPNRGDIGEGNVGLFTPGKVPLESGGKYWQPTQSVIDMIYNPQLYHDMDFVQTYLHELVHAATYFSFNTDKTFAAAVMDLWIQATQKFAEQSPNFDAAKLNSLIEKHGLNSQEVYNFILGFNTSERVNAKEYDNFYGITSPLEFIAEAFTNPEFQQWLSGVPVKQTTALKKAKGMGFIRSIMARFIGLIKAQLGVSSRNSVLDEIIMVSGAHFDNATSYKFMDKKFAAEGALGIRATKQNVRIPNAIALRGPTVPTKSKKAPKSSAVNDAADAARRRKSLIGDQMEFMADTLRDLPERVNLGFMSRDQIERKYRELFDWAARTSKMAYNPLKRYIEAKQAAALLAEQFAKRAHSLLQRVAKLDKESRGKLFRLMRNTTVAQVWPHVSLKHELNDHLWSKPKKGVRTLSDTLGDMAKKARVEWDALSRENPEAAKLLIEMGMLTRELRDAKREGAIKSIAEVNELDDATTKKISSVGTSAELRKTFPDMFDADGDLVAEEDIPAGLVNKKGDSKEKKESKKQLRKEWFAKRRVVAAADRLLENTSVKGPYFPLRRYGKYVVSSTAAWEDDNDRYVSFHRTKASAKRTQLALQEKYGMKLKVTRRVEQNSIPHDVETVVSDLTNKMGRGVEDGINDVMAKRMQTAMYELLAENTAYASELKREAVDGVDEQDMGRAFEEYVFVSKFTLGDLVKGNEIHEALKDLQKLQYDFTDEMSGTPEGEEKALKLALAVNELAKQNKEDARDRQISQLQNAVGVIGFFNFLGAPSYWVLNATQTLTVTLPYLGSKWGVKGTGAYTDAAGRVFKAVREAMQSGDKSYDGFKAKLSEADRAIIEQLEARGIIQSTIAHQFGDILTPSFMTQMIDSAGVIGKAASVGLKAMEAIPEAVEKYNRISTALAIAQLTNGDITAIADGVQATQFNYDSGNRARLLKAAPEWAGSGLRPLITPIMMFKTYGIGISRLLYGSLADVAFKKGGRAEAAKLAGGLIVSHSVFGGVAGGLMMAPVQMLVWAFNEAFREAGDEFDPDEAVELFLQENANDMIAALVARGLPAAVGIDMSKSVNLGNLLWMGNDRVNLADAGGVETWLTTMLGPVAQYGVTTVREGARILQDDPRADWWDFAAAAIPLKMARGIIRGAKYEFEGVGTDTLTWIEPDQVRGWVRLALGFRPTDEVTLMDREYNHLAREARRSARKTQLINKLLDASPSEQAKIWREVDKFNYSLDSRADWIRKGDVIRLRMNRRSRQRQWNRERR